MKQEQRKLKTRAEILSAALNLFSENPYDSVTMDAVAANAKVTKRTLYKYYPSKIALVSSIFELNMQEEYTLIKNSVARCNTELDLVLSVSKVLFDYTKKHYRYMVWLWAMDSNREGIPEEILKKVKMWNEMIYSINVKGIDSKHSNRYSLFEIAQFVSAVNKGIFLQASKGLNLAESETSVDTLYEIATDMYRSYYG